MSARPPWGRSASAAFGQSGDVVMALVAVSAPASSASRMPRVTPGAIA